MRVAVRMHLDVGNRAPPIAVGRKGMLADLEPKVCARLLRSRKLVSSASRPITRVADLEAELEEVRAKDYGLNDQDNFEGIVASPSIGTNASAWSRRWPCTGPCRA